MKQFFLEIAIILVMSLTIGLVYNQFHDPSLPIFKALPQDQEEGELKDFSGLYNEIDAETINGMMEADMAILVDARTLENYKKGHLPKAISLPISDFEQTYPQVSHLLNNEKAIIVYCIGIHCIDSTLLAKKLYQKGHQDIFIYKGGIEDWESLNYPLEYISSDSGGNSNE